MKLIDSEWGNYSESKKARYNNIFGKNKVQVFKNGCKVLGIDPAKVTQLAEIAKTKYPSQGFAKGYLNAFAYIVQGLHKAGVPRVSYKALKKNYESIILFNKSDDDDNKYKLEHLNPMIFAMVYVYFAALNVRNGKHNEEDPMSESKKVSVSKEQLDALIESKLNQRLKQLNESNVSAAINQVANDFGYDPGEMYDSVDMWLNDRYIFHPDQVVDIIKMIGMFADGVSTGEVIDIVQEKYNKIYRR
jgi:hypothetical protein